MDTHKPPVRLRYPRDRFLFLYGLRRSRPVLAQNEFQRRRLMDNYSLQSVIVRNPIPVSARREDPGSDGFVLWVNTIKQSKRPDRILKVAETMPQTEFLVCGGPPPSGGAEYNREFQEAARRHPNVKLKGFVAPLELEDLYRKALLVLHTSESEGFPNVFLEAWSKGVPTVSFVDPDGCATKSGGGVATNDEEMIAAVRELVRDPERRQAASQSSYRAVLEEFSEEAVVKQFETALGLGVPESRSMTTTPPLSGLPEAERST